MNSEIELSKIPFITTIDSLKKEMDSLRPISREIEERILQKFRLNWNYHSNSIEGNPYNYGETVAFLMHGITAKGKTLKDHLDIQGHNDAINFLLSIIKEERDFTETDLRSLHKLLLVKEYETDAITVDGKPTKKTITIGAYKKEPNNVRTATSEIHYYISPEETPQKMQELMKWYKESSEKKEIHPVVLAAIFHYKFVAIHPFDDGNGRMARLLMNLVLLKNNFPPVIIKTSDKNNYFSKLSQADAGNVQPFTEYIAENLKTSIAIWISGAKGENIEEQSDIDKEIALFKAGLKKETIQEIVKDKQVLENIFSNSIIPLLTSLQTTLEKFDELFDFKKQTVILQIRLPLGHLHGSETNIAELKMQIHPSIEGLNFSYQFKSYKNSLESVDFPVLIQFMFEKYKYEIAPIFYHPLISKKYSEIITQEEINSLTKGAAKQVMDAIQSLKK